jgi:hypothetical protein
MSIFEQATRQKLRFDTPKGQLSVEDLWDLPLISNTGKANLDDLARDLDAEVKQEQKTSFVQPTQSGSNVLAELKFNIVLHIIQVRVEENRKRQDAEALTEKRRQIMAIIDRKQNEALEGQSLEDLQKLLQSL